MYYAGHTIYYNTQSVFTNAGLFPPIKVPCKLLDRHIIRLDSYCADSADIKFTNTYTQHSVGHR